MKNGVVRQAMFKLCLQDGREYLWQCSNKDERDIWAMSVSASVRSLGSSFQVFNNVDFKHCLQTVMSLKKIHFHCICYKLDIFLFTLDCCEIIK